MYTPSGDFERMIEKNHLVKTINNCKDAAPIKKKTVKTIRG